jgi:hypothetical protein
MQRALLAFSLLLLASIAIAQTAPAPNANSPQSTAKAPVKKNPLLPYAGNWIGAFENKPWILVTLNLSGEQFSGAIQRAKKVDLSDNGEIKHVGDEFENDPVVEAKLNPDGLLITVKHPDSRETDRYQMKLSADETNAEIKMLAMNMPPGMGKPKPWKLMKVK